MFKRPPISPFTRLPCPVVLPRPMFFLPFPPLSQSWRWTSTLLTPSSSHLRKPALLHHLRLHNSSCSFLFLPNMWGRLSQNEA